MQSSSSRDSLQNSDKFAFYTCNFKLFFFRLSRNSFDSWLGQNVENLGKSRGEKFESKQPKKGPTERLGKARTINIKVVVREQG